ncbi:MAG: glycine cleavage T C-terminal barrel domain-containing protein [Acidobacteriota bacterium]
MYSDDGYKALDGGAGLVRRRDRGVLSVKGADRATWLQGLVTNDVLALAPGAACYAAYLTPQGRMITDLRVCALQDRLLLDVPDPVAAPLRDRLDGLLFAEDVHVEDLSGLVGLIELHGPAAPAVIGRALLDASQPGAPSVVRDDVYGRPGYAIHAQTAHLDEVAGRLVAAGAVEASLETLDVLRIEHGVPEFGIDMDEETIPLEAGIEDRAISFTKGCYVGQELIVRVTTRGGGKVARRLVGLAFSGDDAPVPGDPLVAGDRRIGEVTSVAWSRRLGYTIALGYVHRDFVVPGTEVTVRSFDRKLPARVAGLPFSDRRQ